MKKTLETEQRFLEIDPDILISNNTNDYLYYGHEFNKPDKYDVVSVALEPAIYPYHQKRERVFISDIGRTLNILLTYITAHSH